MVSVEYRNAYKEVLEILHYVSKEDVNKIPKEMLQTFEQNANIDYEFKYNPNETLEKQKVSEKARYIIAILFRDYWATEEQRNKIIAKEKYDLNNIEVQKQEKYSYDKLFENKQKNIESSTVKEHTELVEYKELKWYQKIFLTIKNLLNL